MSGLDPVAGYPVHAVADYIVRHNPHGVRLTEWWANCGATGTQVGPSPFGVADSARRRELCPVCWPAGHATHHPAPVRHEVTCTRCHRPLHPWPLRRADVCSPKDWAHCIQEAP